MLPSLFVSMTPVDSDVPQNILERFPGSVASRTSRRTSASGLNRDASLRLTTLMALSAFDSSDELLSATASSALSRCNSCCTCSNLRGDIVLVG